MSGVEHLLQGAVSSRSLAYAAPIWLLLPNFSGVFDKGPMMEGCPVNSKSFSLFPNLLSKSASASLKVRGRVWSALGWIM